MNYKKYLLLLFLSIFFHTAHSQNWQWALSCGKSLFNDYGKITIDNNSNLYLAGTFFAYKGIFGTDTLIPHGGSDIVFAKINSNGNFVWAKQLGSYSIPGRDESNICYNSSSNSIFLSGMFNDTITLGSNVLISNGNRDLFYSKYDVNGNCIWAKNIGSSGEDSYGPHDSDNNGNLYESGIAISTTIFDNITYPGGIFLAKYNNSGICQWVTDFSQISGFIRSVSCYNNEILVSGFTYNDTTIFQNDTLYGSQNGYDLFLAKYDSNGNLLWAKLDGGGTMIDVRAKFDNTGNIYVTSYFSGGDTTSFGNITFLPSIHNDNIGIVKYDNNGNVIWAKKPGVNYACHPMDMTISKTDGSLYCTGNFQGTLTMDSYTVTTAPGYVDMFLARYDANGNCLGIRNAVVDVSGPNPTPGGWSVAQDANNACYVAGTFKNTTTFGTQTLTSVSNDDIFIAKIDALTGVGEITKNKSSELVIYANPTAGKCNITVPNDFLHEKNLTLSIYDNSGKLIQQKSIEMNEDEIKLDLASEAKGIYYVILSSKTKSYNGKIVFE